MGDSIYFNRPVEGALFMMNQGFKVFPIAPNCKTPAFGGWQDWALSATDKMVAEYAQSNPKSNWGVYVGGSNCGVIDIDVKDDRNGFDTIAKKKLNFPRTLTIKTPSGGYHCYYWGYTRNSANSLGLGIDTRGKGGYTVAPGSVFNHRSYQMDGYDEIVTFPEWVNKALDKNKKEHPTMSDSSKVPMGERNNALASIGGSMRDRGVGFEGIKQALLAINETQLEVPLAKTEVETIALSVSKYAPEHAIALSLFSTATINNSKCIKAIDIVEDDIPKRDWIMKNRYIGGFVSLIIAPGGVGKSSLNILDAVSIASGKGLTGSKIISSGAVWLYNTEDPMDEIKRRIIAAKIEHKIDFEECADIHIISGKDAPLILAKKDNKGVLINQLAIDEMVTFINQNEIRVLMCDPFVRTHECDENDNMQIDKVIWAFNTIADRTGCAIGLVHHTPKNDAKSARGASSLINAARVANTLEVMDEDDAKKFGISDEKRLWYVRLDNAKSNLQPPASRAKWLIKRSITLSNGDSVGTLKTVDIKEIESKHKEQAKEAGTNDLLRFVATIMSRTKLDEIPYKVALSFVRRAEFNIPLSKPASEIEKDLTSTFYDPKVLGDYVYSHELRGNTHFIIKRKHEVAGIFG